MRAETKISTSFPPQILLLEQMDLSVYTVVATKLLKAQSRKEGIMRKIAAEPVDANIAENVVSRPNSNAMTIGQLVFGFRQYLNQSAITDYKTTI